MSINLKNKLQELIGFFIVVAWRSYESKRLSNFCIVLTLIHYTIIMMDVRRVLENENLNNFDCF